MAWDVDRDDWRTFRVDCIGALAATGHRFTPRPPPDDDVAGYLSRGVSSRVYRNQGTFRLHVPAAVAAERIPPTAGVVEAVDERSCLLHAGSSSLEEMAVWIGLIGFDFDVVAPAELGEVIVTLAGRLGRVQVLPS